MGPPALTCSNWFTWNPPFPIPNRFHPSPVSKWAFGILPKCFLVFLLQSLVFLQIVLYITGPGGQGSEGRGGDGRIGSGGGRAVSVCWNGRRYTEDGGKARQKRRQNILLKIGDDKVLMVSVCRCYGPSLNIAEGELGRLMQGRGGIMFVGL